MLQTADKEATVMLKTADKEATVMLQIADKEAKQSNFFMKVYLVYGTHKTQLVLY